MNDKNNQRILNMLFKDLYPHYVAKVERKNQTVENLNEIIFWLTGYDSITFNDALNKTLKEFFEDAPSYHPNESLITGVICGIRIETINDPIIKRIRQLDKLVDELAKGKDINKIKRK